MIRVDRGGLSFFACFASSGYCIDFIFLIFSLFVNLCRQIDEEEMSLRRDLSVPTSLEAPTIDLTSTTARRYVGTAVAPTTRAPSTCALGMSYSDI